MDPYRPDLARIHDDGFGHLATNGAEELIARLRHAGHRSGTVVDLGCGSGITARALVDAGYTVEGWDLSEPLLAMARERVPEATFHLGSFVGLAVPSCVGVCAIGEVLNYAFDSENGSEARAVLFAETARALAPGGVFMLDLAGPDRAPAGRTQQFVDRADWTILMASEVEGPVLTRRITTFRRIGEHYRRDAEVHRLTLLPPERIEAELRTSGLVPERLDAYAALELPRGLHGFVASRG